MAMAGLTVLKKHFPLRDVSSVVKLFKEQLEIATEPDLALLSIIVGAVENSLTCSRPLPMTSGDTEGDSEACLDDDDEMRLPLIEFHIVEALYAKFEAIIKGSVDPLLYDTKYATRELVKRVSDVIWNSLTRSYYKDRAHLQSLYSYLTGNKLDCFGVAFAVVAGCQVLGFRDVHLALSEDHAWVVFGEPGNPLSAEVTWHGKGNEDKRGQPVLENGSEWLYLMGHAVECTRPMEVAALVSAINPSLSATTDAIEVALLQQELLWLLYDLGHLARYPMALGNLGDLEEICPTPGRPPCAALFQESITSSRTYYRNHHVYPYTYQGGYFYRNQMFKQALDSWANAADVIRQYNYSKDDEEIYKEFLEIANELIPHIMKVVSSGHSARSILKDASCFASLLRFYDGICRWEEGSPTPVLHIGWAKPLVNTISKFDAAVRARVDITLATEPEPGNNSLHPHVQPRRRASSDSKYLAAESNNNYELIRSLESQVGPTPAAPHPTIAALTEACGETLLNPGYLLRGIGSPFTNNRLLLAPATGSTSASTGGGEAAVTTPPQQASDETPRPKSADDTESDEDGGEDEEAEKPLLELHSKKMAGLKELLLSEKLNTSAIQLQLTAQSQVQVGSRKRADAPDAVSAIPAAATTSTVPTTGGVGVAAATLPGARAKRARTRD